MADPTPLSAPELTADNLSHMRLELDALAESQRQLNLALDNSDRLGRQFGRTLTNAFVGLAIQGKSFSSVLSTLALSLSKVALTAAFKPLETAFGTAIKSLVSAPSLVSGSTIAAPAGLTFGDSLITGGGGAAGLAGAGDFAGSGPMTNVAAGLPSIVLNVSTPDAESFQRSETQIAAVLARAVAQGQRNL
ncbi:MAG: phage tail tape measure protein [Hyphomicrobiaceae bacterium]